MKCEKCGNQLQDGSTFCNMCGASVTPTFTQVEPAFQPVNNKKSLDPKIIIIIILLIGLVITSVLLILSYNKGSKECPKCEENCNASSLEKTVNTTESTTTKTINYGKEHEYKEFKVTAEDNNTKSNNIKFIKGYSNKSSSSTYINLLFENVSDEMYDGTVYLNYYKNGKRIDSEISFMSHIKPRSKFVVSITPLMKEEFDSYDFTYKTSMKSAGITESPVDNSKIKTEKVAKGTHEDVIATYKNDTNDTVNYYFMILYKKNGEIIGFKDGYAGEVKAGQNASYTFSGYFAPESGYDDFEVIIQSAYVYHADE